MTTRSNGHAWQVLVKLWHGGMNRHENLYVWVSVVRPPARYVRYASADMMSPTDNQRGWWTGQKYGRVSCNVNTLSQSSEICLTKLFLKKMTTWTHGITNTVDSRKVGDILAANVRGECLHLSNWFYWCLWLKSFLFYWEVVRTRVWLLVPWQTGPGQLGLGAQISTFSEPNFPATEVVTFFRFDSIS